MENRNHLFCHKVSILQCPLYQFQDIGQGMKLTWLYMWYPLFRAQLD